MSWQEIRFDEVTYTEARKIRCFGCSKRLSRQRTFRQTVNPYNISPATGEPKTRMEIRAELREESRRWHPQGVCADCVRTGQYVLLPDGNFALRDDGSDTPSAA